MTPGVIRSEPEESFILLEKKVKSLMCLYCSTEHLLCPPFPL
uniref:Uncharacterized protein n=1 Tax=Anguilla anguilla TaxID=7936 RepID=A0A0E9SG81_ANGAN